MGETKQRRNENLFTPDEAAEKSLSVAISKPRTNLSNIVIFARTRLITSLNWTKVKMQFSPRKQAILYCDGGINKNAELDGTQPGENTAEVPAMPETTVYRADFIVNGFRRHPDLFSEEEAAEYLNLRGSIGTLAYLERHNGLKFGRIGKYKVYHRAHLDQVIDNICGTARRLTGVRLDLRSADLSSIPSCVYLLLFGGVVVYVGQTLSIGVRVKRHREDKDFDEVICVPVSVAEIDDVEKTLISYFKPPLNTHHKDAIIPNRAEILSRMDFINWEENAVKNSHN